MTRFHSILAATILALMLSLGCQSETDKKPISKESSQTNFADGLSAEQIYNKSKQAYSSAKSYQDEAVLYLSYTMDGRNIQEEQAWRVAWQREGQLSALWFNAEIRGDGRRLGCFVYDIDSGNLDNQWMLVPDENGNGLSRLLGDSIARHFATGYSELPLREDDQSKLELFIPPTISWLTGRLNGMKLLEPQKLLRTSDSKVDGQPCYHLELENGDSKFGLWIDQKTLLVRQMTLPKTLLDPLVTSSSEVGEIQFFVRFHKARFNEAIPSESWTVQIPRNATPVQQFIAIPEPFPCESIGKPVESTRLFLQDGKEFPLNELEGRTSALIWLSGLTGPGAIARLNEVQQTIASLKSTEPVQIFCVYAEDQVDSITDPNANSIPFVNRSLSQTAQALKLNVKWLFDQELKTAQSIRLVNMPAVVVIAKDRTIEYARSIAESGWAMELQAAIERTSNGEKLSQEMTRDYEQFVERYKRKLELVSARPLLGTESSATDPRSTAKALDSTQVWRNTELQRAGNVYVGLNKLFVFDGWRTICELDEAGKLIIRKVLDLPAGDGVSCLRILPTASEPKFAAFSVLGQNVSIFDKDWKLVKRIEADRGDRVLDCQFTNGQDGRLLVAFQKRGLNSYNLDGEDPQLIAAESLDSLASIGNKIFAISAGALLELENAAGSPGKAKPVPVDLKFVRLAANHVGNLHGIAVDSNSNWQLATYDAIAQTWHKTPISSQVFENEIEPLSLATWGPSRLVLADTSGGVFVFDAGGNVIGRADVKDALHGVAIIGPPEQPSIVTSSSKGV
ncbi:MAG: DUF2092 domain-containing protein, partial [Pirellulaceae bacterium]